MIQKKYDFHQFINVNQKDESKRSKSVEFILFENFSEVCILSLKSVRHSVHLQRVGLQYDVNEEGILLQQL